MFASLRMDLIQRQREIENYREKVTHFEAGQEHFASEIDYWKQQAASAKQELEKVQAQVGELKDKMTKTPRKIVQVPRRSNSGIAESVIYVPSDESYQVEERLENESNWGDLANGDNLYRGLQQKLEALMKEKSELKIKLAEREGQIKVLQSRKGTLQQHTPLSNDVSSTVGKGTKVTIYFVNNYF
jgi:phage shock protein A